MRPGLDNSYTSFLTFSEWDTASFGVLQRFLTSCSPPYSHVYLAIPIPLPPSPTLQLDARSALLMKLQKQRKSVRHVGNSIIVDRSVNFSIEGRGMLY